MRNVDVLLTNACVLTMNERYHQYDPGAVAVDGDSIILVGPQDEVIKQVQARETIDCNGKVLMPGLINAHTHVPMTLLRGLADDLRLDVWLMGYIMPVERDFVSEDFVRIGTKLACAEMIRGGTTCFADMYYFEDVIAEATAECGMRALLGQTVLKFPAPDAQFFEEALARARKFLEAWKGHPLVVPCLAPHAPYTITPGIVKACVELAVEFNVPIHTHLAETTGEVESLRKETGMPVIPWAKKYNLLDAKVTGAHCVHIDEGEMRQMVQHKVGAVHNPSSNLKLASGAAPVEKMLELGVNVGLGTDGPASNNDLDMFEEMRLASFLGKLRSGDPTSLPARDVVTMATLGGARALHISDTTGSLQPGKRADLILVDIDTLHNSPRFQRDPNGVYAQLVFAAKSSDVSDVMVNGKWLMQNKTLKTINENELLEQGREYARRIDQFLLERESSLLSKLVAIGGAMEEESFEIQVKVRIDDPEKFMPMLEKPAITIDARKDYRQFDTYFLFEASEEGSIRYREDELVEEDGRVGNVRARLTLIGPSRHADMSKDVVLSLSRYLAPANNSLRFYREYFKPENELDIEKRRQRFHITYKDTNFFLNVDSFKKPADLGSYLEIKSRTWSREDAQNKAVLTEEILQYFGLANKPRITQDYLELIRKYQG